MFVTLALVYVFVAAMRRASASLRAEGTDADDDETREILRQQKRTVARSAIMTSTPSTRRPLDGAALWSITAHFNQRTQLTG